MRRTAASLAGFGLAAALPLLCAAPAWAHGGGQEPAETSSDLLSAWALDPGVIVAAVVALALFGHGFWRLRRRGRADHAPWSRAALFLAATAVATLALVSPIDEIGEQNLLWVHMLQHVLVGDVAPALAIVALRGPLLLFLLPAGVLAWLARRARLRRLLAALQRPAVCVAIWALVMGGWHIPAAYDYALAHQLVHDLEHLSFLLAGALVWTVLVDPARHGSLSPARRIGVALCVFAAGQALADVLIFSFQPYYATYADLPERLWGVGPLLDQRLAGVVMMADQLLTLGTCVALFLRATLRRVPRAAPGEAT